MKVRRIILQGVNNFVERFDYSFEDDWMEQVPDALVLIGPNGSGKTTLLNVIAGLWELFGRWIESSAGRFIPNLPALIPLDCKWAAVELIGLEDQSLWVFYRPVAPTNWADSSWIVNEQDTCRIGTTLSDSSDRSLVPHFFPPGETEPLSLDPNDHWVWVDKWRQSLMESKLGKHSDLPNMVFLESDARMLLKIAEETFQVIREPEEFRWLVRYEPTARRQGSIENYLFNLSAVDRPTFDRIVEQVNALLIEKRIMGFDPRTRELMVKVNGRGRHAVDQLSSGEKQVLLLIAFITRWLRPGGIVLIDEPDLHLHASWVNALVNHLRRMVVEQDGQLIVASHEPSLWKHFTQSHRVRLGDLDIVRR